MPVSRLPADLTPFQADIDAMIGIEPLAVGWLDRRRRFETGSVPARFTEQLRRFCVASQTVNHAPLARPCPLCNEQVMLDDDRLGAGELRVMGDDDIFTAPDLIFHYVTAHQYKPPQSFIDAVLHGAQPDSAAHRALVNTLNTL